MKLKARNMVLVGLGIILVLIVLSLVSRQPGGLESRVQKDLAVEKSRFLPENSVDIAQAMGMIAFDSPNLPPATAQPPLLLYPPSADTLERLSGV